MFDTITRGIAWPYLVEPMLYDAGPIEEIRPSTDVLLHNLEDTWNGYLK